MSWLSRFAHYDELTYRLGWVLLHSVWQGAIAAVILGLLLRLGRGTSSAKRYTLSLVTLLMVLAVGLSTALVIHPEPRAIVAELTATSISPAPSAQPANAIATGRPRATLADTPKSNWNESRILLAIVLLWGIGVVGLSLWQFTGWMMLWHYRWTSTIADADLLERIKRLSSRMNISRNVSIAMTSRLEIPIVIGVLRPMILVPISMLSELSSSQIQAILAHELAHIKRWDYLINLIQCAVETMMFYHPAIWWISKQIRREREFCCDAVAVEICGNPAEYVRSLLQLEESRGALLLGLSANGTGGPKELLERANRLLASPASVTRAPSQHWGTAAILLLACITVGVLLASGHSMAQTTARAELLLSKTIRVTVKPNGIIWIDGGPSTWTNLRNNLTTIPENQRKQTVIELSADSGQLPVEQFFQANSAATEIVRDLGLAYVSNVGIDPHGEPVAHEIANEPSDGPVGSVRWGGPEHMKILEQAKLQAAAEQKAWDALQKQIDAGSAMTPAVLQLQLEMAHKIFLAKVSSTLIREERIAAAQECLDRTLKIADRIDKRRGQDVTEVQVAQANAAVSAARGNLFKIQVEKIAPGETSDAISPVNREPGSASIEALRMQLKVYAERLAEARVSLIQAKAQYGPGHAGSLATAKLVDELEKVYDETIKTLDKAATTNTQGR